jgi:hypothetical protein
MPRKPKPLIDPFKRPEPWFWKKIFDQEPDGSTQMYRENPPMTFAKLPADEFLTTHELQRLFDCTARTIYRWIADYGLEPQGRHGRDYLFRKDKLIKWYRRTWKSS